MDDTEVPASDRKASGWVLEQIGWSKRASTSNIAKWEEFSIGKWYKKKGMLSSATTGASRLAARAIIDAGSKFGLRVANVTFSQNFENLGNVPCQESIKLSYSIICST